MDVKGTRSDIGVAAQAGIPVREARLKHETENGNAGHGDQTGGVKPHDETGGVGVHEGWNPFPGPNPTANLPLNIKNQ